MDGNGQANQEVRMAKRVFTLTAEEEEQLEEIKRAYGMATGVDMLRVMIAYFLSEQPEVTIIRHVAPKVSAQTHNGAPALAV